LLQQLKRLLGRDINGNGGQREHDDPFPPRLQLATWKKRAEILEAPPMMPLSRMSAAYDRFDVFILLDPPGGVEPFAMRAETTDGTIRDR
jgi:hypothetical protein